LMVVRRCISRRFWLVKNQLTSVTIERKFLGSSCICQRAGTINHLSRTTYVLYYKRLRRTSTHMYANRGVSCCYYTWRHIWYHTRHLFRAPTGRSACSVYLVLLTSPRLCRQFHIRCTLES
jgi:hypothetical protein